MILYNIQWQASHGNCMVMHADKPASIWLMQIILHLICILVSNWSERTG